jgi:hypothetical protein
VNFEWTNDEQAAICSVPLLGENGVKELDKLLREWMRFVESVEASYRHTIDDYTNDLDIRDIIEDVRRVSPTVGEKLRLGIASWDERFIEATHVFPAWSTASQWWYRRVPIRPGPHLEADLRTFD